MVAVKVLNLQREGASKSFMAECKALRNIRHRNLVKIITSCSSIDFEETDNGKDEPHILNLHQRINIALDVACALECLHYQCKKPIVHYDLKPSNILLDKDMVAHVGDFGLTKFLHLELSNSNQNSSIGIRRKIGYVAPANSHSSLVKTASEVDRKLWIFELAFCGHKDHFNPSSEQQVMTKIPTVVSAVGNKLWLRAPKIDLGALCVEF
ncbi:hypothetical protein LguiA_030772 [Lonicera macranthoides]